MPFLLVAIAGAIALATVFAPRRTTRLGTPAWTPARAPMTLTLKAAFTLIGMLLTMHRPMG